MGKKNINAYAVIATLVKVILLMLKAWLSVFLMKAANTFVTAVSFGILVNFDAVSRYTGVFLCGCAVFGTSFRPPLL